MIRYDRIEIENNLKGRVNMYFKKLALCMAIVILFTLLAGCHGYVGTSSETPSIDFESQAHIQVGTSDDDKSTPKEESTSKEESTPTEQSQPTLTGDFVVSEKKYDYKGNNIELLHVENKTKNHYNITIKGKYLDKDGKVIKEETQKFAAFPAGWSNYFCFYPRCTFESFTYVLETEEYTERAACTLYSRPINHLTTDSDGNPLASYINFTYEKKLEWMRAVLTYTTPYTEGRMLHLNVDMANTHPTVKIEAKFHALVLDADGNIFTADYDLFDLNGSSGSTNGSAEPGYVPGEVPVEGYTEVVLIEQPIGGDENIPDNVQGVFTVIFAINEVYDFHDTAEQYLKMAGITK